MAETINVELVEDSRYPAVRAVCVDNLRVAGGKATGSWRVVKSWPVSLGAFLKDVAEIAHWHGVRVTFQAETDGATGGALEEAEHE